VALVFNKYVMLVSNDNVCECFITSAV